MTQFRLAIIAIVAVVGMACASRTSTVIPIPESPPETEAVQEEPVAEPEPAEPEIVEIPLSSRDFSDLIAVAPEVRAQPRLCWMPDKIAEAKSMLSGVTLHVGTDPIRYTETRNGVRRTYREPEKEYALAVLHRDSCEIEIISAFKRGADLVPPEGWDIEVVERSNGIRWNLWNTEFRIVEPANAVVIGNVEPFARNVTSSRRVRTATGATKLVRSTTRSVEYRQYVPYSRDLHSDLLVEIGEEYLQDLVARAYALLRERKVPSRAVPGTDVADLPYLTPVMFERLPLIEQMDLAEFLFENERVVERVHVLFATNLQDAFALTCSSAGACGPYQFTDNGRKGTYTTIRERYPAARLNRDFTGGARDHLNVAMAAVLLHDNNLKLLVDTFGESILKDPRLEEYLAALYNASPARVIPAIRTALAKKSADWSVHLPSRIKQETGGYIVKLRYLQERDAEQ
ncbi:MAG TPA: hypothetical protein VD862_02465 [Candidatus Paceibacterota bacterium]|nr:hypothetical protein [Candidatus Paceibacterota bacterium]